MLFWSCFTATGTIVGMLRDSEPDSKAVRMKHVRTRYITVCDVATVLVIALFGVLSVPFKMKRFVKMVEIWNIVRTFLKNFFNSVMRTFQVDRIAPLTTDYAKYRKISVVLIATALVFMTVLVAFDITIYCMWKVSNDPTYYLQNYICYYMLYFMLISQEVFFWHLVFFIHIRIIHLKKTVTRELKRKVFHPYSLKLVTFKKSGNNFNEFIKEVERIRESVKLLNESPSNGIFVRQKSVFTLLA